MCSWTMGVQFILEHFYHECNFKLDFLFCNVLLMFVRFFFTKYISRQSILFVCWWVHWKFPPIILFI